MPIANADTTLKNRTGKLLITDRKVRYMAKSLGKLYVKSILLSKITGVELKSNSNPAFLLLAVIILIGSYFLHVENALTISASLAVIFAGAYFATLKQQIVISSASSAISFAPGLSNQEMLDFIDKLEHRL